MIPGTELNNRITNIRKLMNINSIDALLISKPKNVLYASGADLGTLIITKDFCTLFVSEFNYETNYETINSKGIFNSSINYMDLNTKKYRDFRVYEEISRRQSHKVCEKPTPIFDVEIYKKDIIKNFINELKPDKLGIENIDFNSYEKLRNGIDSKITVSVSDTVESARMVKTDYEINLLKKSAEIAKKGMEKAYEIITPGISELNAAAEIEYVIRKCGSETPPFEHGILLSSGKNAGNIHGFPTEKKIKAYELIVVDLGARYGNYYSDMTRTIPAGKLKLNSEQQRAHEFIKNLEEETIDMVEIGVNTFEVHKFADEKIKKFGYKFHHSISHGIGLDIHEMPYFRVIRGNIASVSEAYFKDRDAKLCENMVFTIEPGIYVPGKFGVRFEDMVLLTKKGCEVLTR